MKPIYVIFASTLVSLFASCGSNKRDQLIGDYHRVQDDSEISLNLYQDSTFVHSSTSDVSQYGIKDYPGKMTLQLNGKWNLSGDSLELVTLHMSSFGRSSEMNDTMYFKIIQISDDKLVIKSLSNNDICEYIRK